MACFLIINPTEAGWFRRTLRNIGRAVKKIGCKVSDLSILNKMRLKFLSLQSFQLFKVLHKVVTMNGLIMHEYQK